MNWLDAAPFFMRLGFGLLAGGVTWWSACDLGGYALDALRVRRAADDPVGAALGYALLGTIVAVLGLAHAISLASLCAVFVVQLAVRWSVDKRFPLHLPPAPLARLRASGWLDRLAVAATLFAWLTGLIAAALPATWWDPIAYHLPIAARALAQHAFAYDAGMVQTAFPLLGEAAALPAYAIGGSAGAALATLGCGIALALLCGAWSERIATGTGPLATALVSCSALWLWLAPSFYVDIPFALFALAALRLSAGDRAHEEDPGGRAIAAGLLAGAAAATKYPGIVVAAVGLVGFAASVGPRYRVRAAVDFAAGAIALAGAWYARTAMQTGDSLFPFFSRGASGDLGAFAVRYVDMTRTWCGGSATFVDAVMLPWRLLTQPRTFCGDPGYALDLGVVFVLASLALARRMPVVAASAVVLTTFWFASSQQLRFLVPAVCLYAIAAAAGTTVLRPSLRAAGQGALLVLCVVGVALDWVPGPARDASNSIAPAYGYMAGTRSGDDYLSDRLEFYDAVRWLRANGGGAPAAALDDVRDYYFGSATAWLNPYYQYDRRVDWSGPAATRYAALTASGYRYLIVNANDAYVHRTPTGVDWAVLARDREQGVLQQRFAANGVTVYELGRKADR